MDDTNGPDDAISPNLPDELVITLRKPVTLGDLSCTQLVLREPTAGEMMQWDKLAGTEADIVAVSTISGTPRKLVEKIGARDLNQAARYLGGFLA